MNAETAILLLFLGLINWISTTICVESEITRPIRDWLTARRDENTDWRYSFWDKLRYLAGCHLCSGTWIGLVMAAVIDIRPFQVTFGGWLFEWLLLALAIKAVGHLTLVVHKAGEALTR